MFIALTALVMEAVVSDRYADCKALLDKDTELGRTAAQQWVDEGGGAKARHCLALADLAAGFPKLAGLRLEELAQRKDAGDDYVRARLLAQSSEAWLRAAEIARAQEAIASALALVPDSGELQLTAAKVFATAEDWRNVMSAVNAAEDAGFISAETFVYRGRAHYNFGDYQSAADDVVNALSIDATNIDALVLRGDVQRAGVNIDVFLEPAN